jgi:hypothetical protein
MAQTSDGFSSFETNNKGVDPDSGDSSAEMEYEEGEGLLVDLSGTTEDTRYPVIPRGIYDAELLEMEYGRSQRSNNPMWTTIWELTSDKLANKDGQQPRVWLHLTFSDGGLPRVKRALARMKCDDDFNKTLLEGKFDPQRVADEGRMIGARARLRIDVRRYEGQNRNQVRDVLPPAEGGMPGEGQGGSGGSFGRL